ncbi:MAG TPA: hypothetical protein EYN66_11070 [Myxococcales bacterium]|nr:hypothetical protein [Myxococcales bacterium]
MGKKRIRLVDNSRATPSVSVFFGCPERCLETVIWYPTEPASGNGESCDVCEGAPVLASSAAYPLVVYCHGFFGSPEENVSLCTQLAAQGYVVAAVQFPLTSSSSATTPQMCDVPNQPGDVSFVIDRILSGADGQLADLAVCVNPLRIGVVGFSVGGLTSALVGLVPGFKDPRISSVVNLAGPLCPVPESKYCPGETTALFVYGTSDAVVPFEPNGWAPFHRNGGRSVYLPLPGGTHQGFSEIQILPVPKREHPDGPSCNFIRIGFNREELARVLHQCDLLSDIETPANCPDPCPCEILESHRTIDARVQQSFVRHCVLNFLDVTLRGNTKAAQGLRRRTDAVFSAQFKSLYFA